jgi:ankyrin repeat protein
MSMSFINEFVCPITMQVMRHPVTMSDGITYEYKAIFEWLKAHDTSPITKQVIEKTFVETLCIKNALDQLENVAITPLNRFEQYDLYPKFEFNLDTFLELTNIQKTKQYLDECDLEGTNNKGQKPIHYICQYSTTLEIIQYMADKGVDLESTDSIGRRPIHYACQYSTPEIIKYLIDKGVNLESETITTKVRPIHLAFCYSTPEIIKYIIDKGVNLEVVQGTHPIHLACKYSTLDVVQYLVDKGADLESIGKNNWKPINYACQYSSPSMIKYLIDKGVDLENASTTGLKPIHLACRNSNSTPEIIKLLVDKGVDLKSKTKNIGFTPIDFARKYCTPDVVQYMCDRENNLARDEHIKVTRKKENYCTIN